MSFVERFNFGEANMKILKNIFTAIKGGASEVGEKIVDSQSLRIFEQKIRESDELLEKSTQALTTVMAQRQKAEEEIEEFKALLAENEGYIKACIEKNETDLAREIAEKIGDLETELKTREMQYKRLFEAETSLNEQRKKIRDQINDRKRQIALFKAQSEINEALKKTADAIGEDFSPEFSNMASLAKSIEEKQQAELAKLEASEALHREDTRKNLDDKLIEAGIMNPEKPSVDDIMRRYSQQK